MSEYKTKQLFKRNSRENSIDSIHENVSAHEIFINDGEAIVI